MKALPFLSLCVLAATCHAEIFIGPSSPTNRLVIETNQIVVISAVLDESPSDTPYAAATLGSQTGVLLFEGRDPKILAGPGELVFTNGTFVSFRRLHNLAFRSTLAIPNAGSTSIVIAPGDTLRVASVVGAVRSARFTRGAKNVVGRVEPGQEFSGPLTIELLQPPNTPVLYTYFVTEDFAVLPDLGLLQGPTGTFEITVERSADLQTWHPVVVQPSSSEQKAFYRLRIAK